MTAPNAQDRIDTLTTCLEAVADLMTPEPDLHAVNRDKLAVLLIFLTDEFRRARADRVGGPPLHTV